MCTQKWTVIRAFVAIEIDGSVKRHIAAAIDALRQQRIDGLKLVRPDGVHLTLKFLGNISASKVSQIADAMASVAAQHTPFDLTLGAPGAFPSSVRARVLWIGVKGDLRPLLELQRSMDEALEALVRSRQAALQATPDHRQDAPQSIAREQTARNRRPRRTPTACEPDNRRSLYQPNEKHDATRRRSPRTHRQRAPITSTNNSVTEQLH